MVWRNLLKWILHPVRSWKEKKQFEARLRELRKQDPFIYK
jgi:hypothetical protein